MRTSLRIRIAGSNTPACTRRGWWSGSTSAHRIRWSNSPATTAICSSTSSPKASPSSGSSRRRTSPRLPCKGIPTLVKFFGENAARELVSEGMKADLLVGNNVLAQVSDLNDFVAGLKLLLIARGRDRHHGVSPSAGTHAAQPVRYDLPRTLQLLFVSHGDRRGGVRRTHGLTLFDVERLSTHGGSLRIYGRHSEERARPVSERARALLGSKSARVCPYDLQSYATFSASRYTRSSARCSSF